MKPEIQWTNTFDIEVDVINRRFLIPGNEIHGNLKYYENLARARQINIETILRHEDELKKLQEKLQVLKTEGASKLEERLKNLSLKFISYLFGERNRSTYTGKFYDLFLEELRQNSSPLELFLLRKHYFNDFERRYFNQIKNGVTLENQHIVSFLETLIKYKINFFDILKTTLQKYQDNKSISTSPAKRKEIEQKAIVLLEDYQKSQEGYSEETENRIRALQTEINKLREQEFCEEVEENIVIARIGFVVEIRNPKNDQETTLQFIHFPVVSKGKNIHTIYDHFKDGYNYISRTTDDKQVSRNSLIDEKLAKQIDPNAKFNKQLDYHSERDLYITIQDPMFIAPLVENLKKKLDGKELIKVHYVILDLHSSRYMCDRCQEATIFIQRNNGSFLTYLSNAIKKTFKDLQFFPEPNPKFITRVSTDIPFKTSKLEATSHTAYQADKVRENTILAMDSTSIKLQQSVSPNILSRFKEGLHKYTLYTSSENNDPTRDLTLAYNDIIGSVRTEAAKSIQHYWQAYRNRKRLSPSAKGVVKTNVLEHS